MNNAPSLLAVLEKAARELALFKPGPPLLVAVSGGADSMALLYGLAALAPSPGCLSVVHLNHGIRGREAAQDAAFVRGRCRALRISCHLGNADVPALAASRGLSLEMASREARYDFFKQTLERTGARAVATAHTADDQAETVLLKLVRGAGPRGLAGLHPQAVIRGVPVVRPLLAASRREVVAYLNAIRKTWREDRSNRDISLARNRVRHTLLPVLEKKFNPRVREALARTAAILRDEEAWLQPIVDRALARSRRQNGLSGVALTALHPALARRVIRDWLVGGGLAEEFLSYDLLDRLEGRLSGGASAAWRTDAGGGLSVVSEYGTWRLSGPEKTHEGELKVKVPGTTLLPHWGLKVRVSAARGFKAAPDSGPGVYPCRAWLDAGRIGPQSLRIRPWRAGDRLALPAGHRKLQDLFTDAKVPRLRRPSIPLFVGAGGEVVWVAGGPVSKNARVPGPDRPSWQIDVTRLKTPLKRRRNPV